MKSVIRFVIGYARFMAQLLYHQPAGNLATAALVVPFTGLAMLWLLTRLAGVLSVLLVGWGLFLLLLAGAKVLTQQLRRLS